MPLSARSTTAIILGSWFAAYGVVLLLADVKFLRYLEPLAPVFAVGAALAVAKTRALVHVKLGRDFRVAVPVLALTLTFAWTGAFLSIYAHENSKTRRVALDLRHHSTRFVC